MNNKIILTEAGYKKLNTELELRLNTERKRIADEIERARQQGDLSENASYKAAIENKEFNEIKIKELSDIISNANVVKKSEKYSKVQLGASITILNMVTKEVKKYLIVGENEADPSNNKISFKSPFALKFLNKNVNTVIEFISPNGKSIYKILEIS